MSLGNGTEQAGPRRGARRSGPGAALAPAAARQRLGRTRNGRRGPGGRLGGGDMEWGG